MSIARVGRNATVNKNGMLLQSEVVMTLVCDNDHGLLDKPYETFKNRKGIFLVDQPYMAGWSVTYRHGERIWLCPACSGKRKK